MPPPDRTPHARDWATLRHLARAILRQCDFYAANGPGDGVRALLVSRDASRLAKVASRNARRFLRERGQEGRFQ